MARVSDRKKWEKYVDQFGLDLSMMFNRTIRETLKSGVRALVANTHHDSSRAANHWVVIPNRGKINRGSWKEMTFNPTYRQFPVGKIGDQGKNRQQTIDHVVERESRRSIDRTVRGRTGQASVFVFQSRVPAVWNDIEQDETPQDHVDNYRRNAQLVEAKKVAMTQMRAKLIQQVALQNVRKKRIR